MLIQNRENKKYSLGSKLMAMSVKCRTSRSFGRIASKYVDQLGQLTGETVNLSTCSGDRIINVYHAESHFVLRPNFPLYTSYPAYKTGVGRVFLSWMGDPALKWIYENNKDDISMTQEEFLAMLHQARRDGYALDDQVFSAGLRCVAAPVFLTGSKPMFAISISAPVQKITIVPRTSGALGYTMQVEEGNHYLMTKEEMENKIATLTGGRAAEEVAFGSVTTGASNDIEQATKLARAMITRYGMSDDFGMVALETVTNQYLGGDASLACSADTQTKIDQQVVELVKREHDKAVDILTANREKLDRLAAFLYEKETITGEEFMHILGE